MEPILGQVIMFAGNFAPRGWAFCDGQLMPVAQYSALFSLLGTTYGGDGRTTFGLPDLRGRSPMHAGSGPGLTPRVPGQRIGEESVTLNEAELPAHDHGFNVSNAAASTSRLGGEDMIGVSSIFTTDVTATTQLNAKTVSNAGGGLAHDNMAPVLVINHIIALEGVYPSRN